MARSPLATARKQISDVTKEATCRPNSVLTEAKLVACQYMYAACEARSGSKAFWIENPLQRLKDPLFQLLAKLTKSLTVRLL